MKKHISIQKLSIAGLTAFGLSAGLVAGISPTAGAHGAEPVTFTATVQPLDGAKDGNVEFEWKVEEGESAPAAGPMHSFVVERRPMGGNVEFEWKVEEGESLIKPIDGLKMEQDVVDGTFTLTFQGQTTAANTNIPSSYQFKLPSDALAAGKDGAKGGNVEFEWKVEEGES